jgi:hypothetical protein
MEWNNGTIFRIYINAGTNPVVDCKVDISQQELNNNCFIGVENFVLKPNVGTEPLPDPTTAALQDYWAKTSYLQLESFQLAPYIDFNSQNAGTADENRDQSRNSLVFARLPLVASPTLGNQLQTTEATFALDRVLNKDSILYEMRNNPNALANGRLRFRMLDQDGQLMQGTGTLAGVDLIKSFSFTLVVYKASERYN